VGGEIKLGKEESFAAGVSCGTMNMGARRVTTPTSASLFGEAALQVGNDFPVNQYRPPARSSTMPLLHNCFTHLEMLVRSTSGK
jgi:hypothetical protein